MGKSTTKTICLILHDIRSVYNVGAIFRTADAIGISKIYFSGYTPTPLDRFGRERSDFIKSALGAEKNIPWEQVKTFTPLVNRLKKESFFIVGLEQDKKSVDYKKFIPHTKIALVLGNEVGGMNKKMRDSCDALIEIPMQGKLARNRLPNDVGKESLNVSVAAGIALFRLFDR